MHDDESTNHPQNEESPGGVSDDVRRPSDNTQVENERDFSMFEDGTIGFGSDIQRNLSMFENETIGLGSEIDDIKTAAQFIEELKHAKLDNSNMHPSDIARLREAPKDFPFDVCDPDFLLSLRTFLAVNNASQEVYNSFRDAYLIRHPEDVFLSYDQIKRRIQQISGIVPITHDMCIDTCAAFTGPFKDLEQCPLCSEPRYQYSTGPRPKRVPRRQYHTIPLGFVLQALYRSPEIAHRMHHRRQRTEQIIAHLTNSNGQIDVYDDIYIGSDYLEAVVNGEIKPHDIMLQISLDGAQLFRDKDSDCWMYIYVIHNLPPDFRYKKDYVIPGGFIPGPKKPKHIDSFLFPALYHLSALQREGLHIYDASTEQRIKNVRPFLAFATADTPGMASMAGMVGHQGKYGCRLYCGLPGRHREGDGHYYPALLKPSNYNVEGCDHRDVSKSDLKHFRANTTERYRKNLETLCQSANTNRFNSNRLETGICKPTIFSGLIGTLGIPNIFVLDIMHLVAINDPDLLLGLWRGTLKCYGDDKHEKWPWCVLKDKRVWKAHGKTVSMAAPYLPTSFDRAPRNPAEKINSGYKAWEFLLYIFALGPALLKSILPVPYWRNYCKLVRGIQLLQQRSIPYDQLQGGMRLLNEFQQEFEQLYYQRNPDRIHFIRQSIHLLSHIAPEISRVGPLACYSQWTMENAIGNLGEEIRQDYDPYANISQRGIIRAQMNAIHSMMPGLSLKNKEKLPNNSVDLGQGYTLLRACDSVARVVLTQEAQAILDLWDKEKWPNRDGWANHKTIIRWARLRLPNGQKVRSAWGEGRSHRKHKRTTIVRVCAS